MENSENRDYIGVIISGLLHTLILFLALHFTFLRRSTFIPIAIEVEFQQPELIPVQEVSSLEEANQSENAKKPTTVFEKPIAVAKPATSSPPSKTSSASGSNTTPSTATQDNADVVATKKKQFGDLFGKQKNGSGQEGDGTKNEEGGALGSISKGNGIVGGGLAGRKVLEIPAVSENSQKTGKVVVKVCVGSNGKVSSAKFTQQGSTTLDAKLIRLAEKGAAKYLFSSADIESQCGSITFDFKVR